MSGYKVRTLIGAGVIGLSMLAGHVMAPQQSVRVSEAGKEHAEMHTEHDTKRAAAPAPQPKTWQDRQQVPDGVSADSIARLYSSYLANPDYSKQAELLLTEMRHPPDYTSLAARDYIPSHMELSLRFLTGEQEDLTLTIRETLDEQWCIGLTLSVDGAESPLPASTSPSTALELYVDRDLGIRSVKSLFECWVEDGDAFNQLNGTGPLWYTVSMEKEGNSYTVSVNGTYYLGPTAAALYSDQIRNGMQPHFEKYIEKHVLRELGPSDMLIYRAILDRTDGIVRDILGQKQR